MTAGTFLIGTPVQNNTSELWALLNLLDPARRDRGST